MRKSFWLTFALSLLPLAALAQSLPYTTTWLGNTFGGVKSPGEARKHVALAADALFVLPDGTCLTNTPWDEDGAEVAIYKDGDVVGAAGHTHGWGYNGGTEVTANRKYLFFAQTVGNEGGGLVGADTWPSKGKEWFGLSRRNRDGSSAPFPGGKGGSGDTYRGSYLLLNETPDGVDANVSGMACDETHLWVSDPVAEQVLLFDPETMAKRESWSLARPGRIAPAPDGTLWVIQRGDAAHQPRIAHLAADGKLLPQTVTGIVNPSALCLDNRGRLLVTDDGPAQQVQIYSNLDRKPRLVGTLGERGGIFAGQGQQIGRDGPLRFNHLTGVGCDTAGNIYVASSGSVAGGGTVLESYAPSGKRNWRLLGLEFVDNADADPASDGQEVYTKEEHFRLNYAKTAPGSEWSYQGYTVNRFRYPDDPRLHTGPTSAFVRRIGGKLFLFTTDMYSDSLCVFRFNPGTDGEVAIPAGMFAKHHAKGVWSPHQPDKGEWIWRDRDGNGAMDAGEYESRPTDAPSLWGWSVDSRGDVWQATEHDGIRHFPCAGLDAHGCPIYSYATMQTTPTPPEFTELCRAEYAPETDTMYLAGYTNTHPHTTGEWGTVGTEVIRYDHWNKGAVTPSLRIVLPYGGPQNPKVYSKAMCIAGDYVFTVESQSNAPHVHIFPNGRNLDGLNNAIPDVLYDLAPGPEVGSNSGWVDTPYGIRAVRRANGEYVIFVEEDLDAKVIMYRWKPPTEQFQLHF